MAISEYRRILNDVNRLSDRERARLIKELAVRSPKSHRKPNLSKVEEVVAYIEGIRMAESRDSSGRLKTPTEFLAELESWEG